MSATTLSTALTSHVAVFSVPPSSVDGTLPPVTVPSQSSRRTTDVRPITRLSSAPIPAWLSWSTRPVPGNRNDCKVRELFGAKAVVGNTTVIADDGYRCTGLVIPHRREMGQSLPAWKEEHNTSQRKVRARGEHTFARMKSWKILRDCRLRGDGVHHAMPPTARAAPYYGVIPTPSILLQDFSWEAVIVGHDSPPGRGRTREA